MKKILKNLFLLCVLAFAYFFRDSIGEYISDNIVYKDRNRIHIYNEYYLENNFSYVQNTNANEVYNYNDILNVIYTTINSGEYSFTFKCKYKECTDDVKNIINDNTIINNINNFVHPYNSFSTINIDLISSGLITLNVTKLYSDEQIQAINEYIDDFKNKNITKNMSDYDKIKLFHDYIIDNTEYDEESEDSHTAYTLITTGKSICGGYSDIMAIYLDSLKILNYKIASDNHVWNLVYLNNEWKHIDLTWDDPVASDGNQYLIYEYFIIPTDKLLELDNTEHNFNKDIYKEAS